MDEIWGVKEREASGCLVILKVQWKRIRIPEGKEFWGDPEFEDLLSVGSLCVEGAGNKGKRTIPGVT